MRDERLMSKLIRADLECSSLRTQINTMRAIHAMLTEQCEHWQEEARRLSAMTDTLARRNTKLVIECDELRERIKRLETK